MIPDIRFQDYIIALFLFFEGSPYFSSSHSVLLPQVQCTNVLTGILLYLLVSIYPGPGLSTVSQSYIFSSLISLPFFPSVQFSHSVMSDSLRLHESACKASLSITNSQSSLRLASIESVMPSSHLILCRPLLLLPPIPPSIRVFSNESTLHIRWPKYWSFSFSISPSKVIPGLISFRMDWLDLLAVQGILKSLLQHHSSKASIFSAQLSL